MDDDAVTLVLDPYPNYRRLAQEALALARDVLKHWPAVMTPQINDPLPWMIHSTLSRQTDRLEALLVLRDRSLDHVGAPFARLGYEEVIWLAWFATAVRSDERLDVFRTLVRADSGQRIRNQWAFLDEHELARFGFAPGALADLEPQLKEAEMEVAALWQRFDWGTGKPRSPLQLPSVYLVGKHLVAREGQHGYLFASPSQHVHFSPWRLWCSPARGAEGRIQPESDSLKRRESAFALGWVLNYLVNMLVLTVSWEPDLARALEAGRPHYRLVAKRISDG